MPGFIQALNCYGLMHVHYQNFMSALKTFEKSQSSLQSAFLVVCNRNPYWNSVDFVFSQCNLAWVNLPSIAQAHQVGLKPMTLWSENQKAIKWATSGQNLSWDQRRGNTQTGLLSYLDNLEFWKFGFSKYMYYNTI